MSNLDDLIKYKPREEHVRLVAVELIVPTDEQMEKAAATAAANGNNPPRPRARAHFTWEPMSYELRYRDNDEVKGTTEDFIDVSFNLEDEHVQGVRAEGFLGIPSSKLIRVGKKNWEQQDRPWARFYKRREDIMHLSVDDDGSHTGSRGQLYSDDVGKVFRVEAGFDSFPVPTLMPDGKWKDMGKTKDWYMRYILEREDAYVQPEQVPVIHVDRRGGGQTAPTVTATSGDEAVMLGEAAQAAGLIGMTVEELSGAAAQMRFAENAISVAPIFGSTQVATATSEGLFVDYLIGKGAIEVVDGVIQRVA